MAVCLGKTRRSVRLLWSRSQLPFEGKQRLPVIQVVIDNDPSASTTVKTTRCALYRRVPFPDLGGISLFTQLIRLKALQQPADSSGA